MSLYNIERLQVLREQRAVLLKACEYAMMGYQNILEFDLINPEYREDTQDQINRLEKAIAAAKDG